MKPKQFLLTLLLMILGITSVKAQQAYAWLTSDKATLYFCYDNNRSDRSGTTYNLNTGTNTPDWLTAENQRSITSVRFRDDFANAQPTSCYRWFYNMTNLKSVSNLWNLNTSSVTNMNGMFGCCKNLASLEVRQNNFDTSKVTDMTFMFWGCQSIPRLDLKGFTFKEGVKTNGLLTNCSALQLLYLPASGTYADNAFSGVGTVESPCTLEYPITFRPMPIDLYDGCYKWLGGFFIDSRKPYAWLSQDGTTLSFHNDDSLSRRPTVKFFDIYITGNEDKISVKPDWQKQIPVEELRKIEKVVFAPSFKQTRPISCYYWFYEMRALKDIVGIENLRTDLVQNMESMFRLCLNLTELDLTSWNTQKVTNTTRMFMECYRMKTLNLSNFNFTQNSRWMFHLNFGLRTLIVSASADKLYGGSTTADSTQHACYGIGKRWAGYNPNGERCVLVGPEGWDPVSHSTQYNHATGEYKFKWGLFIEPATPYVALSSDKKTLSFYNDRKDQDRKAREGCTIYWLPEWESPDWYKDGSYATVTKVVFDETFASAKPKTCSNWFSKMSNLEEIEGIQYLNTSEVTSMSEMFFNCSKLKSLDVSHFNTSNVLYFIDTFYGCSQLTALDVSNFDTSKATSMHQMFEFCSNLTSLDVSNFNTANVTDMYGMFYGCSGLTSLDVSSFNTAKVTDFGSMFCYCEGLTALDVSHFNTAQATNYYEMFFACSRLTALDVSNFRFDATDISNRMLMNCMGLTSLTVPLTASNWNVGIDSDGNTDLNEATCYYVGTQEAPCQLIYPQGFTLEPTTTGEGWYRWMAGYFYDANTTPMPYVVLDGSTLTFYYDTNKSTRTGTVYELNEGDAMPAWHDQAESVTTATFNSSFQYYKPTSCAYWFADMTNLQTLNVTNSLGRLSYLDTSEATTMRGMFYNCTSLESIPVQWLNTKNVTDMNSMFRSCSALKKFDLSTRTFGIGPKAFTLVPQFKTSNVTDMASMFNGCESLTSITFNEDEDKNFFITSNVEKMRLMFNRCSSLESLDLSHFDTSKVTDMSGMFQQCSSLQTLNLSGFVTSNVTSFGMMFYLCVSLSSIEGISGFNTSNATNFTQMFALNEALASLDVSSFNTSKAETMNYMFYGCSSLLSLDISTFFIPSDDANYAMLQKCSGLSMLRIPVSAVELESRVCQGIGSEEAPCTLVYPTGFTPEPEATGDGWMLWKGGYFEYSFLKGDVNHDGKVSVADVMMTVNHVMGKEMPNFHVTEADMNNDSNVSVADVMQMVKVIIN